MSEMYIRVKKDGFIYPYNEILAKNAGCEVVPEEIAYPERFVVPEVVEKVAKTRKKRGYGLTLSTEDVPEEPAYNNVEVNVDASRKLP
jgi:hypothetical protein